MTTDADGWIEHDGKGMPVDGETVVDVRFRDGETGGEACAGYLLWDECGPGTITRYRIVDMSKPAATATKITDTAPSLRDQFALAALTGILAGGFAGTIPHDDINGGGDAAFFAYQYADAMMTERAK